MSEVNAFLKEVHISNYLSLRDVTLPLKPLTVLVGPNASGKSNVLSALRLLNRMIRAEALPPVDLIQTRLWAGEASHITFQLQAEVEEISAEYELELRADMENRLACEKLFVENVEVISIQEGQGYVRDENGQNKTTYKSKKLALKSAGDYGEKPITSFLTEFVRDWEFYDFQPRVMRGRVTSIDQIIFGEPKETRGSPQLDDDGSTLTELLSYWFENDKERFEIISRSLANSTNISIDHCIIDGEPQLCLSEGYKNPIPLQGASDGTLRLVAYFTLLNQPELPPLIAIEEPERNLHPGALHDIAEVLELIAKQSQVIITTHSSQLLDAFSSENPSDALCILLFRNRPGRGTEVINLEDVRRDRKALDGWIADFGIGSGIFDSGLLQDQMVEPACQA